MLERVSITPKVKIHHPRHSSARDWSGPRPVLRFRACWSSFFLPTAADALVLHFFFCCVVPACLVSAGPLWFRLELLPRSPSCSWLLVCAGGWPVGALTCSCAGGLPLGRPSVALAVRSLPLRRQSDPVRHPWPNAHSCSLSWLVVCSSVVRRSCASMSSSRGDALHQFASSARGACWPPGLCAGVHPLYAGFSSFGTLDDATLAAASFCVLPPLVRPPGAPFSLSYGALVQAIWASR